MIHVPVIARRRPPTRVRRWLGAGLLALLLAIGGPVLAAQRALLVGVSQLPAEPPSHWLQAPGHDVRLMHDALVARGWQPAAIRTLADGVAGAGLPDLAGIRGALGDLVASAGAGDFVLLYFSGHGTRFVDSQKAYDEPDGLAEMFLARDGALGDAEIGTWIQALLARGAFVWAVFDTCSAASMTRGAPLPVAAEQGGDDPVVFRGLTPAQLSLALQRAARQSQDGARAVGADDAEFVPAARYVAFFAAESHQRTPELRLPRGGTGTPSHGLLTWALADALRSDATTWRELYSRVLSRYPPVIAELRARFPGRELPSPVAEGALDVPLFQNDAQTASALPSWPARRGPDRDLLEFDAGQLDGLLTGQLLRLSATLPDGSMRSQDVAAQDVTLGRSRIALPPAWLSLPAGTAWQVAALAAPEAFALRVHADAVAQRQVLGTLSLPYPVSLQQVAPGQAELQIAAVAGGGYVLTSAPDGVPRSFADAATLRQALAERAVQRWLRQLLHLARSPEAQPLAGFDAALWPAGGDAQPLTAGVGPPGPGAQVEISNASGRSVDVLLLGLAADGGLLPIFPAALGQSSRFERGDVRQPARKRFALPERVAVAGGGLLVLATPARPHSMARFQGLSPRVADDVLPDVLLRSADPRRGQALHAVLSQW